MIPQLDLPVVLGAVRLRRATAEDLPGIVELFADDAVSASRGDIVGSDLGAYRSGLERVLSADGNDLIVAVDAAHAVVGMLQLTVIPGVSRRGATRLLVESVRVSSRLRGGGVGTEMMRWVMDAAATATGASLVQLTSDSTREGAHRFYLRLGFTASHVGFKYQVG